MRKGGAASRWSAETEIEIQFYDLDPMQIVWHGNYVKYLEVARCALFDSIDYNYVQMKQAGHSWPVIDMNLRYIGPATFGQKLRGDPLLNGFSYPQIESLAGQQGDFWRQEFTKLVGVAQALEAK